ERCGGVRPGFFQRHLLPKSKNPANPYGMAGWVRTEIADCAAKSAETGSCDLVPIRLSQAPRPRHLLRPPVPEPVVQQVPYDHTESVTALPALRSRD